MEDLYTHTFKILIGKNGENRLIGECGFDPSGEMLFKITETSAPFKPSAMNYFLSLVTLLKQINSEAGGFRNITIKMKGIKDADVLTEAETTAISEADPIKPVL